MLRVTLAILAILVCASSANAADADYCSNYSRVAMIQVNMERTMSQSIPRCSPNLGGSRWSTDNRVHFSWCRRVSPDRAEAERKAREAYMLKYGA